jgi:hypothetical protein
MTNEQINEAIAELVNGNNEDYCNDLNAMNEAEKTMTEIQCTFFRTFLREKLTDEPVSRYIWHASARQRAEALLKTIGKWEEQ